MYTKGSFSVSQKCCMGLNLNQIGVSLYFKGKKQKYTILLIFYNSDFLPLSFFDIACMNEGLFIKMQAAYYCAVKRNDASSLSTC